MDSSVASEAGEALPGSTCCRQCQELTAISAQCRRPEQPLQPGPAIAVTCILPTAREGAGSRVLCRRLRQLHAAAGQVGAMGSQAAAKGQSLSQRKSFPCPHSEGSALSEDEARMDRGWAPSALSHRLLPHHPSPAHSTASALLSPPLSSLLSAQAGAFNYSCPPLQSLRTLGWCHRLRTGAGWEAPAGSRHRAGAAAG